jgi:hypothetical protein
LFREGTDFTVLDRSRGEWGEPSDDLTSMGVNYLFLSLQRYSRLQGVFEKLHSTFWSTYLDQTGDQQILRTAPPFLAWRALVLGNPLWYPSLSRAVREKLFRFIENVLADEQFRPYEVNNYLE